MIINEITKGIPHIEDLPVNQLTETLNNMLDISEITEKVDGAELLFGIDEHGFYTSREAKGGARIYKESDYGIDFPTTYMRSAHKLLEQSLPLLRDAGLRPGDQVEAEVLYGEVPNVVPYSADTNYLIFLRTTEGQVNIDRLKERLDGHTLSISLLTPYTNDGRTIDLHEQANNWKFARVPRIFTDTAAICRESRKYSDAMSIYLKTGVKIPGYGTVNNNATVLETPLNKCPTWVRPEDWKTIKPLIKEKKAEIQAVLTEKYILPIKEVLLKGLVHNRASQFGPPLKEGGWIEGVVLRNPLSGSMVKIVDKNKFGVIRESAWKERNNLTEAAKSTEGEHSFIGNLRVNMARALGHPELGTIQAKAYLRRIGETTEERLSALSEGIEIKSVIEYWDALLENAENQLEKSLTGYEKEKVVNIRNEISFDISIKKRVLETYASTFQKLHNLSLATLRATEARQLVMILSEKQLTELE